MVADTLGDLIATLGSIDDDEIDWPNIRQATVLIHQTFRYDYPGPITDLRQRLMVVPPDYHGHQRLATHKLRVSGCNLDSERSLRQLRQRRPRPHARGGRGHVEFMTWAVVEMRGPGRRQREPRRRRLRPPLRRALAAHASPTSRCERSPPSSWPTGATGLELAALISARVHDHFVYEWGVTTVETTAAEAWAGARGVCQDYAHCMVALCRLCGLPARYVSGHLLGDGGTHAWVEVLVQEPDGGVRAVAFDPTHDRRAGPRYVTVAVGRDYGDVPPTSGTFEGPYAGELTTHKRAAVVRVEYLQPQRRRRVTRD